MSLRTYIQSFLLAPVVVAAAWLAMPSPSTAQTKELKQVPIRTTDPSSGAAMFKSYCASCHGTVGKGDGPAVVALKVAPGDLTLLSKNNGGKFPELRVFGILEGTIPLASHGSRDMPMWGELFRSLARGDNSSPHLRMRNLTEYVRTIQVK